MDKYVNNFVKHFFRKPNLKIDFKVNELFFLRDPFIQRALKLEHKVQTHLLQ